MITSCHIKEGNMQTFEPVIRGGYYVELTAILENAEEKPVPQVLLEEFRQERSKLTEPPVMRVPPHIQALYLEEQRLKENIAALPVDQTLLVKATLSARLQMVQTMRRALLFEALPVESIKGQAVQTRVGENWDVYVTSVKLATK